MLLYQPVVTGQSAVPVVANCRDLSSDFAFKFPQQTPGSDLGALSREEPVIRWRRGSWPGAGAAMGMLLIDSAIARTRVCRVRHPLRVFSCAREEPVIRWRRGSWPGAGAAMGMLLIDSAIARTGVCRVRHPLRVFSCAREKAVISWRRVVAGCRCSYGDAAD